MEQIKAITEKNMYSIMEPADVMRSPEIIDMISCGYLYDGYVYPYRSANSSEPGIRLPLSSEAPALLINEIPEEDKEKYRVKEVIDYSKADDIKQLLDMASRIRDLSDEFKCEIEDDDEILRLPMYDADSPVLSGLKEIINAKNCPRDAYLKAPSRDGKILTSSDRNNMLRLLTSPNNTDITLKKVIEYAERFDIGVTINFSDSDPAVPNPAGREVTKTIV